MFSGLPKATQSSSLSNYKGDISQVFFWQDLGDKGYLERLYWRHKKSVSETNASIRQERLLAAGNHISFHLLLL